MAQYRFYQDKEVKTWIRDYFTVEAESLEDAIKFIQGEEKDFDTLEGEYRDKIEFDVRDNEVILTSFDEEPIRYSIFSCDLENKGEDGEILNK